MKLTAVTLPDEFIEGRRLTSSTGFTRSNSDAKLNNSTGQCTQLASLQRRRRSRAEAKPSALRWHYSPYVDSLAHRLPKSCWQSLRTTDHQAYTHLLSAISLCPSRNTVCLEALVKADVAVHSTPYKIGRNLSAAHSSTTGLTQNALTHWIKKLTRATASSL